MMGKTHTVIGLGAASAAALAFHLPPPVNLLFIWGAVLGSLLPDIDHSRSTLGQWLHKKRFILCAVVAGWWLWKIPEMQPAIKGSGILLALLLLSGHRKFTHSIWAVLLLGAVTEWCYVLQATWAVYFLIGGLLGYCLHIAADCLTERAVNISWPSSTIKIKLGLFSTNGLREKLLYLILSVLSPGCFCWVLYWSIRN